MIFYRRKIPVDKNGPIFIKGPSDWKTAKMPSKNLDKSRGDASFSAFILVNGLLILALFISSCASIQRQQQLPKDPEHLRLNLIGLCEAHRVPECTVVIAWEGKTWQLEFSQENGALERSETEYNLASVSKVFTALTVLELENEGLLSLDDAASSFLPNDLENTALDTSPITIEHLLRHTSGLAGNTSSKAEQIVPAGIYYQYSNRNYQHLASIIESLTKKSLEEEMRERIFLPLGMTDARLAILETSEKPNSAQIPLGAGGVFVHGQDMSKFLSALTSKEDNFVQQRARRMLEDIDSKPYSPVSLCWQPILNNSGVPFGAKHAGIDQHAGAELYYYPHRRLAFLVMTTTRYSPSFFSEMRQEILRHLAMGRYRNGFRIPQVYSGDLQGLYKSPITEERFPVVFEKGDLIAELPGKGTRTLTNVVGLEFVPYALSSKDELALNLARADSDKLEFIRYDAQIVGLLWQGQFYRRLESNNE